MKNMNRLSISAIIALLLLIQPSLAEVTLEAGTTIVGQQASKQNNSINRDVIGSVDLVMGADIGPGRLHIYGEGSTTPAISANSVIAGANHDAGSAVDKNGNGRVQLSAIRYDFDIDRLNVSLGVQDLTAFADTTAVSNDETSQFLAGPLVHNPAVAFPDYTPSLVLSHGAEDVVNATLLVANAYGLGDNPSANYADLFKFGRDKNTNLRKGIFTLAELRLPNDVGATLGGWMRTSELPQHLGGANRNSAFGVYANADGGLGGNTLWSARLGWNSARTTDEVIAHASMAVEHSYTEDHVIALGVAWNGLSPDFRSTYANAANPMVAELYYRWQVNEYVAISPDVQYWSNANSLSKNGVGRVGGSAWVCGLRVQIGVSHRMTHTE
ncbi:MAG: carbohydrate porin [Mariprofundaceae bacterium]|nr:carbohydrate porin [Mariprofundaceae bacterium]